MQDPIRESWSDDHDLPETAKSNELPVDETEDFNDPYSELSLFLSKKIKKELEVYGSLKKWSSKIQKDLLGKILPEFKKAFPNYRLGASALKKMWEKVSYYYDRVAQKDGAVTNGGTLNIPYMIRENLKTAHKGKVPSDLAPYNVAQKLAVKLSECIATLDGVRPNLDMLTQTIWAAHKHILTEISPKQAKSPYEEFTGLDKLIVKTMLEICAHTEDTNPEELTHIIVESIKEYSRIKTLLAKGTLVSTLSSLLADRYKETDAVKTLFSENEQIIVNGFITRQFAVLNQYKDFSVDTKRIELVSRILALFPLANSLPKDIDQETLEDAIVYMYDLNTGEPSEYDESQFDQSLLVFLNTEMHLYPNKEPGEIPAHILTEIIQSYYLASHLPPVDFHTQKALEVYIWNFLTDRLEISKRIPIDIIELLHSELGNVVVDTQNQPFRTIVNKTADFLRKALTVCDSEEAEKMLKEKSYIWALQQDMICRHVHFDSNLPLLQQMLKSWKKSKVKEADVDHREFIENFVESIIQQEPELKEFRSVLFVRSTILYKYMWYNLFTKTTESTYSRYIKFVKAQKKAEKPNISANDLLEKVRGIAEKTHPLIPFSDMH